MLNEITDLKALVNVKPHAIDMDDTVQLSKGETEFENFLHSSAENALAFIQSWGYEIPTAPLPRNVLRAEVLLVKAEIIEEYGLADVLDPEEFQVGGQNGERRKSKKLSVEERGEKASAFRNKAYFTLFGSYPQEGSGIA
ncbi:hypothetical protein LEP1GSC126_2879 [Leptospira kirschneri str. 200801774]|uniref:hypothetical protein n=1 Tax=Leptospira kirschneri TaxID=29507 RepID=UPI0002BE4195|nr:hypothetical protein [Leptospira kirschneri]EMO79254.1 hypothetical protein LEP1GSC126_2879 [Leptospira kirschneri str. 200801774]